jgi:hypothetical protein
MSEAPALTDGAAEVMRTWNLLGGYELQRLATVDAIDPVRDPEAVLDGLVVLRDALRQGAE